MERESRGERRGEGMCLLLFSRVPLSSSAPPTMLHRHTLRFAAPHVTRPTLNVTCRHLTSHDRQARKRRFRPPSSLGPIRACAIVAGAGRLGILKLFKRRPNRARQTSSSSPLHRVVPIALNLRLTTVLSPPSSILGTCDDAVAVCPWPKCAACAPEAVLCC